MHARRASAGVPTSRLSDFQKGPQLYRTPSGRDVRHPHDQGYAQVQASTRDPCLPGQTVALQLDREKQQEPPLGLPIIVRVP